MTDRVSISDRIFSALSYVSMGWIGFLYCIFLIFNKKRISYFLKFNVFQTLFMSILFFVLSVVFGYTFKLLSMVPFVQIIISWIQLLLFKPMIFQYSLLQAFLLGIIGYGFIYSILGKLPRIYWISKIIDYNLNR